MKNSKPRKPFSAMLDEPQTEIPWADRLDDAKREAWARKLSDRHLQVLVPALLAHYEIADDDEKWFWLALELARDFVPAFHEEKRAGRRYTAEQFGKDFALFHSLSVAETAGQSVKKAAGLAATSQAELAGRSPEWLRQRYYRLKDPTTPEGEHFRERLALLEASGWLRKRPALRLVKS